MLSYARPDRLSSAFVQLSGWGLTVGATVELACITLQAARGRRSHFNTDSSLDAAIAGTMAVLAILFVGMLLPLAWEIAQRQSSITDPIDVDTLIAGVNHVVVMLSDKKVQRQAKINTAFVQRLVPAMRRQGVRRILYQAGGLSRPHGGRLSRSLWMIRTPLHGRSLDSTAIMRRQ